MQRRPGSISMEADHHEHLRRWVARDRGRGRELSNRQTHLRTAHPVVRPRRPSERQRANQHSEEFRAFQKARREAAMIISKLQAPSSKGESSPKSHCSGFTLIELVISASLMAMILGAAYLCLNAAISGQKLIEPRAEVLQNARVAMAMLSADLRSACPLSKDFEFLGMHRMLDEVEADNLEFATHNYIPRRPREG